MKFVIIALSVVLAFGPVLVPLPADAGNTNMSMEAREQDQQSKRLLKDVRDLVEDLAAETDPHMAAEDREKLCRILGRAEHSTKRAKRIYRDIGKMYKVKDMQRRLDELQQTGPDYGCP